MTQKVGTEPKDMDCKNTEFGPTYLITPVIIGVVVFFATIFGTTFVILALLEGPSWLLVCGGVAGALLALLSWWWAFSTWKTRRQLAGCRLVLEGDGVRPNVPCRLTITGLDQAKKPRFSFSYLDRFQRRDGRKVYQHGPFFLDVDVQTEVAVKGRETHSHGRFLVKAGQIKPDAPDKDWLTRTVVVLKMKVPGFGSCMFELPYLGDDEEDGKENQILFSRHSIIGRLLGQ